MKHKRLLPFLTAAALCFAAVFGPAQTAAAAAFDLPQLYGQNSSRLLSNPDRGFRHELNAFVGTGTAENGYKDIRAVWPYPGLNSTEKVYDALQIMDDEVAHYESDSPKLAQVYLYLTKYSKTDELDDAAFKSMDAYFENLKAHGIKAVLRFTYAYEFNNPDPSTGLTSSDGPLYDNFNVTPPVERVIKHIRQLEPWMEKWAGQIHVVQAGIAGAWGEWDGGSAGSLNSSAPATIYPLDRDGNQLEGLTGNNRGQRAMLITLLENIPEGKHLEVRYQYNKFDNFTEADTEYYDRIGFHDDAIRGNAMFSNNPGGNDPSSAAYTKVRSESANTLVDGEMYWGTSNTGGNDGAGAISADGLFQFKHLKERHFTSLSIVHNYKERGKNIAGISTSMIEWKNEYLNKGVLEKNALPYDPAWLRNEDEEPIARSLFEYIRDYLGYYIKAESGSSTVSGSNVSVSLTLKNYGFSAPHGLESINLVLIDSEGAIADSKKAFALGDLQPLTAKTANVTLTAEAGTYKVALQMLSSTGEGARLANDIPFENGCNILDEQVTIGG